MTETETIVKEYLNLDDRQALEIAAAGRQVASHNTVELCAIINIRSGACAEDCSFCAQSVHYETGIAPSQGPGTDDILSHAERLEKLGVKRLSLVSSGKALSDRDLDRFLAVYRLLRERTGLALCASHGMVTLVQAVMLKESGVSRYHHNLETGEAYFPKVCTTHTYAERLATIRIAAEAGLEICSGGLIGMGESFDDRLELAVTLRQLGVTSIPLNVLMPVSGTPLENNPPLTPAELLKTVAMFRIINPWARLRFAGGRPLFDVQIQARCLAYGMDAVMVGDYLTKKGSDVHADIEMLRAHGFTIEP